MPRPQVDLKIVLGLCGVLIVLLAVAASVGFLSLFGIEGSLIILEVVPFLVLAVGVDNLFILVHSYEVGHAHYYYYCRPIILSLV